MNIYTIIAVIGLLCIITGTLLVSSSSKKFHNYIYPSLIAGGVCLEIYSIYLNDTIFIILQGVFIISSFFGLIKMRKKK